MTAEAWPAGRLEAVLGSALGTDAADVRVANLRRLTRSPSRTTWALDAVTPLGPRALILYLGQGDRMGGSFEVQARAQAATAANGVPVPPLLAGTDSPVALGHPFLLSEMVDGETDHRRIVSRLGGADGRTHLLRQCASALAAIHRVDASTPEPHRPQRLSMYRRQLDSPGSTSATFEWALRWLTTHEPPPAPPVLVHGDYRMGNLLVDGADLTGVLDWEWVHVGEANEDLAWFCVRAWRFGAPAALGAGGLGSVDSFLGAYEEAGGVPVDRVGFHWWLVMATLFSGIFRRELAHAWSTERDPTVQRAVLGRQICETEFDLMQLLDGQPPETAVEPSRPLSSGWKDLLA